MEGVNLQGPLHPLSHPLFSLSLSYTDAHTVHTLSSPQKVKGGDDDKKKRERRKAWGFDKWSNKRVGRLQAGCPLGEEVGQ